MTFSRSEFLAVEGKHCWAGWSDHLGFKALSKTAKEVSRFSPSDWETRLRNRNKGCYIRPSARATLQNQFGEDVAVTFTDATSGTMRQWWAGASVYRSVRTRWQPLFLILHSVVSRPLGSLISAAVGIFIIQIRAFYFFSFFFFSENWCISSPLYWVHYLVPQLPLETRCHC